MPEMHLRQSGFNCSACEPLTENKDTIRKYKETGEEIQDMFIKTS